MSKAIDKYLDRVMLYANPRDFAEAQRARGELYDHIMTKVEQLESDGLPREDAIFQALEEQGEPKIVGYGLRPAFPWLDVRTHGTARGVIAIGPRAVGIVASGGVAVGVVAFGGVAVGAVGVGGLAVGMFLAWAAVAVVPFGLAFAAIAIAMVVAGAIALGLWAPAHVTPQAGIVWLGERPEALAVFDWPFRNELLFWTLLGLGIFGLIAVNILTFWMQHRERRRLLNADPRLAE